MEYWSVEKKDIKPLAITPTLQYSNAPNFIYWVRGILGLGLQINTCEFGPADLYFIGRVDTRSAFSVKTKIFSRFRKEPIGWEIGFEPQSYWP